MGRRLLILVLFILGGQLSAVPALAAGPTAVSISVNAEILPARYIYLDKTGSIYKVASNTSWQIAPEVLNSRGEQIGISPKVSSEYSLLLAANGGNLDAGYYYPAKASYAQLAKWLITNPYFSQKIY